MKREARGEGQRANIFGLTLSAMLFALCFSAQAQQQPKKIARVGFLLSGSRSSTTDRIELLRSGLRDLGYSEGNNIVIEYRYADNKFDRLPDLAGELVRLKVEVIFAWAGPAVQAAKNATKTIPIVMGPNADPVETGLVASLARPGGNITGVSLMGPDVAGKRLELLKEVLPKLSRVALLLHGGSLAHQLFLKESRDAAQILGIQIQPLVVKGSQEFEDAFLAITREKAQAVLVQSILLGSSGLGPRILDLATRNGLLTISDSTNFAAEGGLISYGPSRGSLWKRIPVFIDKILKGAKPADLPVEQPTKFDLVINLKTAKQIGLTIPPNVLARADKVIR
jgi:putative tryptophan/tyrosine transport system substrate-binding protein